jgi:hypothetical protein
MYLEAKFAYYYQVGIGISLFLSQSDPVKQQMTVTVRN